MLTWKTQIWEKTTAAHGLQKYHYERIKEMGHRDNDLLLPSFANRRLQQRQQPLSLSHTL